MNKLRSIEPLPGTKLTVLSFSGGTGSGCIAEMVLNGDLKVDGPFIAVSADPGMEDERTYRYLNYMSRRFADAGIEHITVRRNLYQELLDLKTSGATRFDLPPYWTKNRKTGKRGRLLQLCTQQYKIAPMDAAIRDYLHTEFGISRVSRRLGNNVVRKFIGFSRDEALRVKEAKQKYVYFQYPLIALGMTKTDIKEYYNARLLAMPPRSVCSACFANDLAYFKSMYLDRPANWAQAVRIDDEVRDLSQVGVRDEVYVSSSLIPLRDLPARDFKSDRKEPDKECHSGYCFT